MSRRTRRSGDPVVSAEVSARVRGELGARTLTPEFSEGSRIEARQAWAIDAARAMLRHGCPELHFAQLDAYDDARITRLLVIKIMPERFGAMLDANRPVGEALAPLFAQAGLPPPDGTIAGTLARARGAGPAMQLDCDMIVTGTYGLHAGMTFLSMSFQDRMALLLPEPPGSVTLRAEIEVSMTAAVLVDLLSTWSEVVASMGG